MPTDSKNFKVVVAVLLYASLNDANWNGTNQKSDRRRLSLCSPRAILVIRGCDSLLVAVPAQGHITRQSSLAQILDASSKVPLFPQNKPYKQCTSCHKIARRKERPKRCDQFLQEVDSICLFQ